MKKLGIIVFLFFSVFTKGFSQKSLNDYSYVVVPEQFEFLNEKDKYQLNSILHFKFNKHGFHAFFSNETPDAKRCDGLYADLIRVNAFLNTKFIIVLRNCDKVEIYRTPEGVSKIKAFKQAYQDALRKAFINIEGLHVQQKEIEYFNSETRPETNQVESQKKASTQAAVVSVAVASKTDNAVEIQNDVSDFPTSKFTSYSNGGKSYLLRKTSEGYSLYEEATTTDDGLKLVGKIELLKESKVIFTDTSENLFKASFDATQNLSIQKRDGAVVYKREY